MVEGISLHEKGGSSSNGWPDNNNKKGESTNGSRTITSTVINKMAEGFSLHEEGGTSSNGGPDRNNKKGESRNGSRSIPSTVIKALCVAGGFFFIRKLTKSTASTRVDHAGIVAEALSGEKFSSEQAARNPMTYFNLRMLTCPAVEMANGSKLLYFEQAFWRTPEKPYRQRFCVVKPCPKDMKCDVEVASYAIKNIEEYRNFCARPDSQRPQSNQVLGHVGEHLNTIYLSQCERGRRCLYEGSTPPGGFPNLWNGATHCTSELTIYRNGEIHCWDRAYNDEGNQVWGVSEGPYEFKPASSSTFNGPFLPVGVSSSTGGMLEPTSF